jgi:toxin ParE1/3/4
MRKIIFHPEAQAELRSSARWYNSQQPGLGAEFREEAELAVSRVQTTPEAFGMIEHEVRCHLVHRFPYGIVYQIRPDDILIVAVMHLHRDPDYWKHRMENE